MMNEGSTNPKGHENLETYFAPAKRTSGEKLLRQIASASANPVIDGILTSVGGVIAVLNEDRQVIAVNPGFLNLLGLESVDKILGLRPGEAIGCIHSDEMEAGCGTSKVCSSCGAAIAIVSSLVKNTPEERECVVTVGRDKKTQDLCFTVRACPIRYEESAFILLLLRDITIERRRESLERIFLHDISNTISGIQGMAFLLQEESNPETRKTVEDVRSMLSFLSREIEIQRILTLAQAEDYQVYLENLLVDDIMAGLIDSFRENPIAQNRKLNVEKACLDRSLRTDQSLLSRILTNMVTNALEATEEGGEVRLWVEMDRSTATFHVWNRAFIPEELAPRIFQRHFTTKDGMGRGLGTFAMKMFGEKYLKGDVGFETSREGGTRFYIRLPRNLRS